MRLHESKRWMPVCGRSEFVYLTWFFRTAAGALVIVIGMLVGPALAANYYVATNGSNTKAGTLASPFLTIQQAANAAQAGDNVYVRGGDLPRNRDGGRTPAHLPPRSPSSPIAGEQVTVTGLDVVGSSWSPYSGSIYSTTVAGGASQLFVNGQMMTEARWPDTKAGPSTTR